MGAILLLALLVILPAATANAFSAIAFAVKAGFFVVSWIAAGLLLVAGAGFVLAVLAH